MDKKKLDRREKKSLEGEFIRESSQRDLFVREFVCSLPKG